MPTWKTILNDMSNGHILITKDDIKNKKTPFLWRTSMIDKKETTIFKQSFVPNKSLPLKQDYTPFNEHISKNLNKSVIAFPNLSGDTILVVPIPQPGKNFATMIDFVRNADEKQQSLLWKCVAKEARKLLKKHNIWISTHGMGVPYLHVRLCNTPKYYGGSKLKD